jgi:hypothetical protein
MLVAHVRICAGGVASLMKLLRVNPLRRFVMNRKTIFLAGRYHSCFVNFSIMGDEMVAPY